MNPLNAKLRFQFRTFNNILFVVVSIVIVAVMVEDFGLSWMVDAVAIAVLCYLYFCILNKRAIGIRCQHCLRYIASNTPWECGFCEAKNKNVDDFPFVNRCEHCSAEPKAYKCHHRECGKLIFLTSDHLEQGYAQCINAPVEDKTGDEISNQEREMRTKTHELAMADLDEKLETYKNRKEMGKKKTPIEVARKGFEEEFAEVMAAEEFAREQKAAYDEKYKDAPEMRERMNAFVDDWLKKHA